MSSKKKRNKRYKGGVSASKPSVVKVSAVKRHPAHQWWIDHRRVVKPALIVFGIVVILIVTIIGIVSIII